MSAQILLPLQTYPNGNSEMLVRHAAAVTAYLDGDINALVLSAEFPQVSSALGNLVLDVPSLMAGARETCRQKGASLLQALTDETKACQVKLKSEEILCYPSVFGDHVGVLARYHDFVMMGLTPGDTLLQSTAEAVVFGSGRPVILLPEQHEIGTLDHVMIAWDGSRVAARAVSDARPFIDRAARVTIAVAVGEKKLPENSPGERLASHLSAHGCSAELAEFSSEGRPIAEALQDEAAKIGAGILVMGGFGHSRMRDFVLGGATRGILADPRMAVLVSH